jgi:chitosanase
MTFTHTDKLKALAIVHLFETSRPFGNYAACTVLSDGAGVSYGINQFTHRSGSLLDVVGRYLKNGGTVGTAVIVDRLPTLRDTSRAAILRLAADSQFKNALRAAAVTREMKTAQIEAAYDLYLKPAVTFCERYGFVEPLSLAVVYDSLVHGSFYRVAHSVSVSRRDEHAWIAAYVRRRDEWLLSYTRLAKTRYRTRFFLDQIAISNWALRLPLKVHGVTLATVGEGGDAETGGRGGTGKVEEDETGVGAATVDAVKQAAEGFDKVDGVVSAVTSRADAAKSMWTAVGGTVWQAVWAVFGFFAGLPREVWITVAVIAALLMLAYLYRQIVLGKIREQIAANH